MLKKAVPPHLADGSNPAMPASSIMSALIASSSSSGGESRAVCALAASSIVSKSSTCSRGALAAAFEDMDTDAVGDVLRKKC